MTDADGTFIDRLAHHLVKPVVLKFDEVERVFIADTAGNWKMADLTEYRERPVEPLVVHTLAAVPTYLNSQPFPEEGIVYVRSYEEVQVVGPLVANDNRRHVFLRAVAEPAYGDSAWRPGQFYDLEPTIIALQTRFAETATRDTLLRLLSNVRDEAVRIDEDSGFFQKVTVRKGAALATEATVKNPFPLKPFRTFREVEQPESLFVVRFKSGGEDDMKVALFEADGGAWKQTAIQTIASFLRENVGARDLVLA